MYPICIYLLITIQKKIEKFTCCISIFLLFTLTKKKKKKKKKLSTTIFGLDKSPFNEVVINQFGVTYFLYHLDSHRSGGAETPDFILLRHAFVNFESKVFHSCTKSIFLLVLSTNSSFTGLESDSSCISFISDLTTSGPGLVTANRYCLSNSLASACAFSLVTFSAVILSSSLFSSLVFSASTSSLAFISYKYGNVVLYI